MATIQQAILNCNAKEWNVNKRYRVGQSVFIGEKIYQNITGGNSNPIDLSDWILVDLATDFNPSDFDLEEFTNESLNPFVRESELVKQSNLVITATLGDLGVSTFEEVTPLIVTDYVASIDNAIGVNQLFTLEVVKNGVFDVESTDWAIWGIVDEASFITYFENSGTYDMQVSNFSLVGNRISCELNVGLGSGMLLSLLGVTKINAFNGIINLEYVQFDGNSITEINNFNNLPKLLSLDFQNNLLTTAEFNKLNSWALIAPDNGNISASGNTDNFNTSTTYTTLLSKGWIIS